MGALFRPAVADDIELLLGFSAALYAEDGTALFVRSRAEVGFRQLVNDESLGRVWLIEDGGRPVGYLILTWGFTIEYEGRVGLIDELYVEPGHRSRGLGARAIQVAEVACRERGIRALQLEVARANARAQALYRREGFVDHDRYLMTKELKD
jgi:ribosomal protein S18 acetylase RimI-like enzyme